MATSDYRTELDRRIAQFRAYLNLMQQRRGGMGSENCFIIFDYGRIRMARQPTNFMNPKPWSASRLSKASCGTVELARHRSDEAIVVDLPDEGWRDGVLPTTGSFSSASTSGPSTWISPIRHCPVPRRKSSCGGVPVSSTPWNASNWSISQRTGRSRSGLARCARCMSTATNPCAAKDMAFIGTKVWRFPVDWTFFCYGGGVPRACGLGEGRPACLK